MYNAATITISEAKAEHLASLKVRDMGKTSRIWAQVAQKVPSRDLLADKVARGLEPQDRLDGINSRIQELLDRLA